MPVCSVLWNWTLVARKPWSLSGSNIHLLSSHEFLKGDLRKVEPVDIEQVPHPIGYVCDDHQVYQDGEELVSCDGHIYSC